MNTASRIQALREAMARSREMIAISNQVRDWADRLLRKAEPTAACAPHAEPVRARRALEARSARDPSRPMATYTLATTGADDRHQHTSPTYAATGGRSRTARAHSRPSTPASRRRRGADDDIEFLGAWDWCDGRPR